MHDAPLGAAAQWKKSATAASRGLEGLFTNQRWWVDVQKPDPIGVSNGACIDPSVVFTAWV